jgi:hypothetical protein
MKRREFGGAAACPQVFSRRCSAVDPIGDWSNVVALRKGMNPFSVGIDDGKRQQKSQSRPRSKERGRCEEQTTSGEDVSKAEGGETAAARPSNYSRGEGQKPVTTAYRENWNEIYAKKNAKKKKR